MERDQLHAAMRASLLLADKPCDRHNSYAVRARDDERLSRAATAPWSPHVENVVPLHPRPPEPPRSAA